MNTIYLDNAATSWPKPEAVYQAVDTAIRMLGANPGRGVSSLTRKAGLTVLETRESLARLFGVTDPARIAFCANVTEALNTALKGILVPGDHVITTSMEHNSVVRPLTSLADQGVEVTFVPCAPDGSLDPADIEKAIRGNTRMICLLHASNVTGTIMPVPEVGAIARKHGLLFLVDSAQSAGVLPIEVEQMSIDVLCFTGHKSLLGPQGTGGICLREGVVIRPLKQGGTGSVSELLTQPDFMPDRLESGTLNTPGIAGLGAGVDFLLQTGLEAIRAHELALTEQLLAGLREIPGVTVYGPEKAADRVAVVPFLIEGMDPGELSLLLDSKYGIISRSGLHCSPLAHQTLGTHETGLCRFSPGFFTTPDDIDFAIKAVHAISPVTRGRFFCHTQPDAEDDASQTPGSGDKVLTNSHLSVDNMEHHFYPGNTMLQGDGSFVPTKPSRDMGTSLRLSVGGIPMLYTVKSGDSLSQIARRFNTTVERIMDTNVICNPNLIFAGQLLLIPEPDLELPLAGAGPYYIVKPGDTLHCLSRQFEVPVDVLMKNNNITSPTSLRAWSEILVIPERPDALELKRSWESTPGRDCTIYEPQRHGIYYLGTFRWQALGRKAIPFLIGFLDFRCEEVRYYVALALGRIGMDDQVKKALSKKLKDPSPAVAGMAKLALTRIGLVEEGYRRTHLLTTAQDLYASIGREKPSTTRLAEGTPVTVLQWMIPSPTGEEGPKGGIQIYDYVEVIATGQKGFLPRAGDAEIRLV